MGSYEPHFPRSTKIHRTGSRPDVRVPFRRLELAATRRPDGGLEPNPPLDLYDTSGAHTDPAWPGDGDPAVGLPPIRAGWIAERGDVEPIRPGGPLRARPGRAATQRAHARRGLTTPEMEFAAIREGVAPERVREEVAAGRAVIPLNPNHPEAEPMVIGAAFRTKINANLGNSGLGSSSAEEVEKARWATLWGADTVMDLSTGAGIHEIREAILRNAPTPVGTVPLYQALVDAGDEVGRLDWPLYRDVLIEQAEQGVDYFTIHAGVLAEGVAAARRRRLGIVSRGGSILARWMARTGRENFLHAHFADICDILRRYDVTFSLGDGLRPGCLADANDEAQLLELRTLGELTRVAWEHDCQVMIEGPGHVPLDLIRANVDLEVRDCLGAPFYTLGPLVTDCAAGHDHLSSAIGGAVIGWLGAAMICYVTPREHLGLPDRDDVREGVIAHRIAAHAADVARGVPGARDRDDAMTLARRDFRWQDQCNLSFDPLRARDLRRRSLPPEQRDDEDQHYCSMCGEQFCSLRPDPAPDAEASPGTPAAPEERRERA